MDYISVASELNGLLELLYGSSNDFMEAIRSSNGDPKSLEELIAAYQRWMEDELHRAEVSGFLQALKAAGIEKYTYRTTSGGNICEKCVNLDGEEFKVSEAEEGITLPPMHPNCRCRIGRESSEFDEYAYWEAAEENVE